MWLSNNVDLSYISIRDLTWEWILEMDRTRTLEHDIYYIITVWCEIKIKMKDQVFLFAQLQHSSKSLIGSWLCLLSHFVTVLCQHGIVWSRHTGPLIQQLLLSSRFWARPAKEVVFLARRMPMKLGVWCFKVHWGEKNSRGEMQAFRRYHIIYKVKSTVHHEWSIRWKNMAMI